MKIIPRDSLTVATTKEKMNVMQAFIDGEPIEGRNFSDSHGDWVPTEFPGWDFPYFNYRVKPKRKTIYVFKEKMFSSMEECARYCYVHFPKLFPIFEKDIKVFVEEKK